MGPFAPSQTDFSVAGTAAYGLGPAQRGLRCAASTVRSTRACSSLGPRRSAPGTFLGVDLRDAQGFGVNRSSTSAALNGRLELALAPDLDFHALRCSPARELRLGRHRTRRRRQPPRPAVRRHARRPVLLHRRSEPGGREPTSLCSPPASRGAGHTPASPRSSSAAIEASASARTSPASCRRARRRPRRAVRSVARSASTRPIASRASSSA